MPTFGNCQNNSKTVFICLAFHFQSIGLSRFVYVGAIFSAVTKCRGFHPDCDRLAEKLALLHLRLFPRPFSSHAMECRGIVGQGTNVCRFKSVPTSVIADRLAHAHIQPEYLRIPCCFAFRCLAVNSVWDWSRMCGKWLRNQVPAHHVFWPVDTLTGQHGIWKIFFTFHFHILP